MRSKCHARRSSPSGSVLWMKRASIVLVLGALQAFAGCSGEKVIKEVKKPVRAKLVEDKDVRVGVGAQGVAPAAAIHRSLRLFVFRDPTLSHVACEGYDETATFELDATGDRVVFRCTKSDLWTIGYFVPKRAGAFWKHNTDPSKDERWSWDGVPTFDLETAAAMFNTPLNPVDEDLPTLATGGDPNKLARFFALSARNGSPGRNNTGTAALIVDHWLAAYEKLAPAVQEKVKAELQVEMSKPVTPGLGAMQQEWVAGYYRWITGGAR
jgi:hypothetical protein